MKTKIFLCATICSLLSNAIHAEVVILDVQLSSAAASTPESSLREAAGTIYSGLDGLTDRSPQQQALWTTFDYLINTAPIDDPNAIEAINQMSPKRNGTSAVVTRKAPSTIPVKGIGKRLSALRKSTRRFNMFDSIYSSNTRNSSLYDLMPGLIKYNTDPALESGGLFDQRLSGFITTNLILSKQSDTSNEAGFDGNAKQLTFGADYRINNKTFAGAAASYSKGDIDMLEGGSLDNTANTLLIYATRSINQSWFADATISFGKRKFEMERTVSFTLNNLFTDTVASSNPDGNHYGFSLGTGYDMSWSNGHSISLLASFNYTKSSIDAFKESGNNAYNLAVSKQNITSKMLDAGIEWRQAISTNFGVLLPQVSFKWVQEFENDSDPINAYFIADPNNTNLNFETGNRDQGHMNLLIGVTTVLPRGIAAFLQYETQQFIDDYQQTTFSLGARKEF